MKKTISTLFAGMALAASVAFIPHAYAQGYPTKPVKLVLPYSPGGPFDGLARGLAERLSAVWGQSVIVENKPGASEIVAADAVAKAAPDGYTLMIGSDAGLALNMFMFAKLPYDTVNDLTPVTQIVDLNMVLITRADFPANNAKEFITLMKKDGDKYNYAATSKASSFEQFTRDAGFKMTEVVYKGAAPAMVDILGGQVHAIFAAASAAVPMVKAGKMKVLAVSGKRRSPLLPDVPTFAELGYPSVGARVFIGLVGPKGMPDAVTNKISTDVSRIVNDRHFAEKTLDNLGFDGVGSTPEQFSQFLQRERELAAQRIRAAGIKPE